MKTNKEFTRIFRKVPEGYIGYVTELPGANSQGVTLEEVKSNLEEAISLVLKSNQELLRENRLKPRFHMKK